MNGDYCSDILNLCMDLDVTVVFQPYEVTHRPFAKVVIMSKKDAYKTTHYNSIELHDLKDAAKEGYTEVYLNCVLGECLYNLGIELGSEGRDIIEAVQQIANRRDSQDKILSNANNLDK